MCTCSGIGVYVCLVSNASSRSCSADSFFVYVYMPVCGFASLCSTLLDGVAAVVVFVLVVVCVIGGADPSSVIDVVVGFGRFVLCV